MRTERLYYENVDRAECEARILERAEWKGRPAVLLDRTVFYPEGGGQPCDLGDISGVEVLDVQERNGEIHHVLASALPDGDETVVCHIEALRRRDHAEQHTGQHLLSATILRLAGGATVSFHLGHEYSTVDINLPDLARETLDAIEDAIAAIIRENHNVVIHECPPEKLSDFPLRRPPPQGEEALRIVDIDGLDYSACCGTHLPNTGRIGALHILRAEKYKGMTRVYFVAGQRARLDARRTVALAREAARILSCGENDVPERAARAMDRVKELEAQFAIARGERAEAEAKIFLLDAPKTGTLILPMSDRSYEEIVDAAKAVASAAGRPAAAASRTAFRAVAVAPDASFKLGERLKPVMSEAGGKGGGGAAQFQAQFPDESSLMKFLETARKVI